MTRTGRYEGRQATACAWEVHAAKILVDRQMKRDQYVPSDAIQGVTAKQLVLTVPAAQVDAMDWLSPGLS